MKASIAPVCFAVLLLLGAPGLPRASASDDALLARITALRAEIARHDDLYFRKAAPEITDYEYDLLVLQLERLEKEAGLSAERSPSLPDDRSPDAPVVDHRSPMLSLDKAYADAEVAAFFERIVEHATDADAPVRFSLEPKFDGIAVNVILRRGELLSAATRGNGAGGEDITAQLRTLRGLSYEWAFDDGSPRIEQIELRGEVFLPHDAFASLNAARVAAGLEPFRHPRSVAAGSIKLDDLSVVATRGLSLVFHGWGEVQPAEAAPTSVMAFQRWLEARGLPGVGDAVFVAARTSDELNAAIERLRATPFAYPTDGIVIKADDVSLQTVLGNGPTAPRWALARKFAPPGNETVLRRIVWQLGRTGTLTPVAEFDPVVIDGTTVARASLHNPDELARRDLRLGDTVRIEKAGEIIPQLVGVELALRPADATPCVIPETCPSCARPLHREAEPTTLTCLNRRCPEQVVQRLLHFASRSALGIRGLGPGMAEKLVTAGLVRSMPDLFTLTPAQLVTLPGVGERSAEMLLASIDESRRQPLRRVLVGIGLPGVGPAGAKALATQIDDLGELLDEERVDVALAVLGPRTAGDVRRVLADSEIRREIALIARQLESR